MKDGTDVVNRTELNRSASDRFDIPVVLFIFRRLDTVKLIMEQIGRLQPKTFYVFADAARDGAAGEAEKVQAVRDFVSASITWECDAKLCFRERNFGCANNITEGLSAVFAIEPYAIILEDDAVPKQDFFYYCQYLLKKYAEEEVQFIAGFNAVGNRQLFDSDYAFSNAAPMSGAIATWAERWNKCDFSMKKWPMVKKTKEFRKSFCFHEMYRMSCRAYEDSYQNVNDGWDYQFHFDMYANKRFAIVPKGNLVKSYGYVDGAFHPQSERQARNLNEIMDYSSFHFGEPVKDPEHRMICIDYDKMREKLLLEVNGNYLQRHLRLAGIRLKEIIYRYLPRKIWDGIKRLFRG